MFYIYKREVQSYFYSPLAYAVCGVFTLIFSIFFLNLVTVTNKVEFSFSALFYDSFFYFAILIPALTMKVFSEDKKIGTETLLFSAPINVFDIVIGKFLAVATVYLTMMATTFIFPLIAFFSGEVIWSSLICGYIGFFAWGLVCIAIGMLMSSFTESQIIAALLGEAAMVALIFVDILKDNVAIAGIPVFSNILQALSPEERFVGFSVGIFNLSDLIFYLSITVAILAWTMISVEKRRWSRG